MPVASCSLCLKSFKRRESYLKNSKKIFCSRHCFWLAKRTQEARTCFICGKQTYFIKSRLNQPRHFCSMDCYKKDLKGRKMKESTKKMLKETRKGSRNPNWKGDIVAYKALHQWVRTNIQHSSVCILCKAEKKLDIANISQEYKRDLSDWEWLCRRCHMIKDGRLERFIMRDKRSAILRAGGVNG